MGLLEAHDLEVLTSKTLAHVATIMPDGSPHVAPVWVDAEDGLVLINSPEGRVRLRNLRRDPRVALSVVAEGDLYDNIAVRGRAVEITHDGADAHIDKLAKKYVGRERFGRYEPQRVLVKIAPERIARYRD
ncbi:MAG TPA: PPOX class F420-dependent oxidoreductase [Actinomycetota bacterium]|nr:PPOX class F420-dependent oxidoreductase [Actinomycetota bacterium]